ncbi:MAG: dihydrodipicolinate synthase family protein [Chloroflexi bacterium]|nr:dihydrodipicolinate synthase family protein [Chloroflexota bacterium]
MSVAALPPIRPRRKITGMSAILLPFTATGDIDWDAFRGHVRRTADAGLVPAVNMDTGYVNLLTPAERHDVLAHTADETAGGPFVAGAFVGDSPGASWNLDAYRAQIELIHQFGGTPVIFQSYGLTGQADARIVESYQQIARHCPRFIAFELGTMFAPFGKIYSLEVYAGLLDIAECVGAKHSSLSRSLEWERIALRDRQRPDFMVLTGNDLAIDMVTYGSDYLLGLSTFAPDVFAQRDSYWLAGDDSFYELNDLLQYLGFFAFRKPVPAYKHSAAQFLHLRGLIGSDLTHPLSPVRPVSDREILHDISERLNALREAVP